MKALSNQIAFGPFNHLSMCETNYVEITFGLSWGKTAQHELPAAININSMPGKGLFFLNLQTGGMIVDGLVSMQIPPFINSANAPFYRFSLSKYYAAKTASTSRRCLGLTSLRRA